jgi:hypothetical protein
MHFPGGVFFVRFWPIADLPFERLTGRKHPDHDPAPLRSRASLPISRATCDTASNAHPIIVLCAQANSYSPLRGLLVPPRDGRAGCGAYRVTHALPPCCSSISSGASDAGARAPARCRDSETRLAAGCIRSIPSPNALRRRPLGLRIRAPVSRSSLETASDNRSVLPSSVPIGTSPKWGITVARIVGPP